MEILKGAAVTAAIKEQVQELYLLRVYLLNICGRSLVALQAQEEEIL